MKKIHKLCTDVLGWMIEHNSEYMPPEIYDSICGESRNLVTEELSKNRQCYIASNRLHSIKIEDAKMLLAIYLPK
jgi:hypothetical protein